MSGRVQGPAQSSWWARMFCAFTIVFAGGLVVGGVAIGFGAPVLPVIGLIVGVALIIAGLVTR